MCCKTPVKNEYMILNYFTDRGYFIFAEFVLYSGRKVESL